MNFEMIKSMLVGGMHLLCGQAIGAIETSDRDPTAPSPRILEKLVATSRMSASLSEPERPREAAPINFKQPEIRLKAMVFSDSDHASAILSVNGRSIVLNLSRQQIVATGNGTSKSSIGFTVEGDSYSVEDFSDHSIVLRSSAHQSSIVVQ